MKFDIPAYSLMLNRDTGDVWYGGEDGGENEDRDDDFEREDEN
ncbi:hypothetical protein [Paraburkholderia adhaesiva]|nr:hypothetical protein [Paraburkholderia adhaesiva]